MKVAQNVQTARQLQESQLSPGYARQMLRGIEAQLTDPKSGRIQSGYLKLTDSGQLNAGSAFTRGSYSEAAGSVRELIKQAYSDKLGAQSTKQLDKAPDTYLAKSGGAIGTRSFVKLLRELEKKFPDDSNQAPQQNPTEDIKSRLALPELKSNDQEAQEEAAIASQTNQAVVGLRSKQKSPVSDSALAQFQLLANAMRHNAPPIPYGKQSLDWKNQLAAFRDLMFPKASELNAANAVQGPDAPRTFAMGDADGSMGRMVLHAIASGVAELPAKQMPAMARLMNRELSASLDRKNGLKNFQADPQVSKDLSDVADALIVKPKPQDGQPACIFLGDILSDRFTNNQEAMAKFIYKLSGVDSNDPGVRENTGVRFIAGNHDTLPLLGPNGEDLLDKSKAWTEDWGAHAHKKLPLDGYQQLLGSCFQAADYSGGVLTTHNGVAKGKEADEYLVGVGSPTDRSNYESASGDQVRDCLSLKASSPEELAQKMNDAFKDRVNTAGPDSVISTDFRPRDNGMTPKALGFDAIAGFRQLHGHNDNANEANEGVTNLNARGAGGLGGFKFSATVLEYAAPEPAAPPPDPSSFIQV